jgi:hypothetical protein
MKKKMHVKIWICKMIWSKKIIPSSWTFNLQFHVVDGWQRDWFEAMKTKVQFLVSTSTIYMWMYTYIHRGVVGHKIGTNYDMYLLMAFF